MSTRSKGLAGILATWFLLPALLMVGTPISASAGPNANAKILIHLLAPTTKNACTRAAAAPPCSSIVTAGELYPTTYFAYVLVTDGDASAGVAGAQFGIDYAGDAEVGVDIFSWALCATLEFTSTGWPSAGEGNLITWDTGAACQRIEPDGTNQGVTAVLGYFYCGAYSPDLLQITTRPADDAAKVVSCTGLQDVIEAPGQIHDPSYLGYAAFSEEGVVQGQSPCGVVGGWAEGCGELGFANSNPGTPPSQAETQIGTIEIAADEYVYLLGERITGHVVASFRNGVSYLNGKRWRPPAPEETQVTRPDPLNMERSSLSSTESSFFSRVPYVQSKISSQVPLIDAVNAYIRRRSATIQNVQRVYGDALKRTDQATAAKIASAMIDERIALREPENGRGPDFSANGDITLEFRGYGAISVSRVPDVREFGRGKEVITETEASQDFQELARYVEWPRPSVALYSAGGRLLCVDQDAEEAIAAINQVLQGISPDAVRSRVLSKGELAEIVARGGH